MNGTTRLLAAALWVLAPQLGQAQTALERLEQQIRPAEAARGVASGAYLGVIAVDPTPPERQVRVERVVPGGPAERAGLREGDLLLAANAKPLASVEALGKLLGESAAGRPLVLEVRRGEVDLQLNVVLANPRATQAAQAQRPAEAVATETHEQLLRKLSELESRLDAFNERLARLERLLARLEAAQSAAAAPSDSPQQ